MVRSHKLYGTPTPQTASGQAMSKTYAQADLINKEGFRAFSRTLEEDTLSVLLTNTLSNTFYASEKELAKETLDVLKAQADQDPEFLAKACVYAREKGLMKLTSVIALAILSAQDVGGRKDLFRKAFPRVVQIPDDLREFVAFCRTKQARKGLGGQAKVMAQHWLRHMSEFHAVKYGSSASEGITLRDILRMTHPRPKTEAQRELFGWLVNGWKDVGAEPSPRNPMVWALEKVKRSTDAAEIVSLVKTYKLPWEVVVPSVQKMTKGIWTALMHGMPYMALLRNLNTMTRHGVLEDKETVKALAARIADPENVRKSKQFPFRFWNAFNAFTGSQTLRDALTDALEASFQNMPEIKGRVCVSNDISWSMNGKATEKGTARFCDIAGIFGAALFKKCEDVVLLPFDNCAHPDLGKVSRRDSVMGIAQKIGLANNGTNLGAPIEYLHQKGEKVDTFIGITDNEDWAGRGFLTYLEIYRKAVNPKMKAILVTIAPHRNFVAPTGYPDVWFVQGWSDAVLRYIPFILEGGRGQVEDVRKVDLNPPTKATA